MDHIGSLLHRPRLYCNIDGLGELGGGVMCLGYALLLWALIHSPAQSFWHQISIFGFVGLMFLIHYGTKAIKTHITYPRTGFVEYRRLRRTTILAAALGALAAVGLSVALRRHWDIATPAALIGLVFAASYAYHFASAARWKWAVAAAIAIGSLVIAFLPGDLLRALGPDSPEAQPDLAKSAGAILLSLMVYGTLLLISGGISFWLYLRHTPAPSQEGQ